MTEKQKNTDLTGEIKGPKRGGRRYRLNGCVELRISFDDQGTPSSTAAFLPFPDPDVFGLTHNIYGNPPRTWEELKERVATKLAEEGEKHIKELQEIVAQIKGNSYIPL